MLESYNPGVHAHRFGLFRVRSPLLTESLLVFFSSAYLDVSVQRVCDYSTDLQSARFPHSDTCGSIGRLHLPALFRSLPRPSSPPGAKASPIRSYSLPSLISSFGFTLVTQLLFTFLLLSFPSLSMNSLDRRICKNLHLYLITFLV